MTPLDTSLIALAVILCGTLAGVSLRLRLPQSHLSEHTRDVLKLGAGLVGTISALVLSLLIATANGSYNSQRDDIQHMAADFILLDQLFAQYGPETKTLRSELRQLVAITVDRIWQENRSNAADQSTFAATGLGEDVVSRIIHLEPQNDVQKMIRDRAIQLTTDVSQTRLLLFEQSSRSLPLPFLLILIFWLSIIFASFGLLSPFNLTLAMALAVFAASASAALFLVLELSQPFSGVLQLPSTPLRNALGPL